MTRIEQMAERFDFSPARLRAALARVRESIVILEYSDDRAFTGPNRDRLKMLMADEVALSGALKRITEGTLPEQLEFSFA